MTVTDRLKLLTLDHNRPPSITDKVYEALYVRIMKLDLLPGSKLSEVDVANQLGVSRQPVRDAFYRLSQVRLLMIRPQRATVVTPISVEAVLEAMFVRTALELETVRAALPNLNALRLGELGELVTRQQVAVRSGDREGFHMLDDEFHLKICEIADHGHVWTLIQNHKAHMDRIRYLSLETGAQKALNDHAMILEALKQGDEVGALSHMRAHLSRIETIIGSIRAEHSEYFDMAMI